MSRIYRCMDCGKEFKFDYTGLGFNEDESNPEEFQKKVKEYTQQLGVFSEINICFNCLQPLKTSKDFTLNINREDKENIQETCKKYINELKEKYGKDEEELSKFSIEEEEKKLKELNELQKQVDDNEANLNNLLKELEKTEENETNFCDDFRDLEMKIYSIEKDLSKSNDIKLDYENKIKSFSNTNIFSELFQISFNDKFGIINGCKFCDPNASNNFDNINGGWGYIVLLTKLLSIKYNFISQKFDLIPIGNFSKIIEKQTKEEYEILLNDVKIKDKFNNAMAKYLEYLDEFMTFLVKEQKIEQKNEDICPKICGDKINNKCIRIQNVKDKLEDWYQCMKYLLTILKFLICQVLIDENQAYKETIDNIDIINNSKPSNNIGIDKP